jgi:DDE superfamily endonuclease
MHVHKTLRVCAPAQVDGHWFDGLLDQKGFKTVVLQAVGPTMIILDEFIAHPMTTTKQSIAECVCHRETIPVGFTWRRQVMDVGITKYFKEYFSKKTETWSCNVPVVDGKKPKSQRCNITVLVCDAFNAIT